MHAVRSPTLFPTAPLDVDRDGERGLYVATVAERVYLPPAGSGGAPFTRRMLMLWDPESSREFALASDDSISTIAAPSRDVVDEQSLTQPWLHLGVATQIDDGRADAWVGKLLLIPPRNFVRTASQYGMHVLDLAVLPCAPSLRRNDASPPAHNFADGACYPPTDFPKAR